jgi:hypothetical protein
MLDVIEQHWQYNVQPLVQESNPQLAHNNSFEVIKGQVYPFVCQAGV